MPYLLTGLQGIIVHRDSHRQWGRC